MAEEFKPGVGFLFNDDVSVENKNESTVVDPTDEEIAQVAAQTEEVISSIKDNPSEEGVLEEGSKANFTLTRSWENEDVFFQLASLAKEKELVRGIVRRVTRRKLDITYAEFGRGNRRVNHRFNETALVITFESGVTAYCPASEFYGHEFRSFAGFIGLTYNFVIIGFDLENNLVIVSEKQAAEVTSNAFMEEIALIPKDRLLEKKWMGTVSGYNKESGVIFIRIQGKDCFMKSWDWEYSTAIGNEEFIVEQELGREFEVVVKQFDEERGIVHVSRKLALNNPYDYLKSLQNNDLIAGKVKAITPAAIFVEVENGVTLLGDLQPNSNMITPVVGDKVKCRVMWVRPERNIGRVEIYGYSNGKRKHRTPGAFLFD